MLKTTPLRRRSAASGFTLVEMMVALVAGLLVVGAGISMLSSTFGSNASALRMTRMNQDLRGLMNAISYDITRAGAWGIAAQITEASSAADLQFSATTGTITASALKRGSALPYTGFTAPLNAATLNGQTLIMLIPNSAGVTTRYSLTVSAVASSSSLTLVIPSGVTLPASTVRAGSWTILNPFRTISVVGGNCILFSYDLDLDGVLDTAAPGAELFGYRLDTTENAVEGTTTSASCTAGNWENVTDPESLNISQFTLTQVTTPTVLVGPLSTQVREYTINLGGRLVSDTGATRALRNVAVVRNHWVQ